MARVNVETRALAESRFHNLARDLGMTRSQTIGLLIILWHDSQERRIVTTNRQQIEKFLDAPNAERPKVFDALVEHEYLKPIEAGAYEIRGNAKHVLSLSKLSEAGRAGGIKSGKQRRQNPKRLRKEEPPPQGFSKPIEAIASPPEPNSIQYNTDQFNSSHFNAKQSMGDPSEGVVSDPPRDLGTAAAIDGKNANRTAWEAYRKSYSERYDVDPVRNATVNAAIASFVKRVGAGDAPAILAFYLRHNDGFYVKNHHSMTLALKDAESLRTQWARGKPVTGSDVRNFERGDHVRSQLRRIEAGEV